jgi:hypothetical protein
VLARNVGRVLTDTKKLQQMLVRNPIAAWTGTGAGGRQPFFQFDGRMFASTVEVAEVLAEEFRGLVRELCEWRLADYTAGLSAEGGRAPRVTCRVSRAGDKPILFLPDRRAEPGIPEGWVTVVADGEPVGMNFVKVAVNVARRPGDSRNMLSELLKAWFGEGAGAAGRADLVVFELAGDTYHAKPVVGAVE